MTETFTSKTFKIQPEHRNLEQAKTEESFYNSLKSKLDDLKREPSDETILKILNHAKKR